MKPETKFNKIMQADLTPRMRYLKLVGLGLSLIPQSEIHKKVFSEIDKLCQEYRFTF